MLLVQELEQEVRGAVSGVQTGLQSAMDLAKFGLVIALPHPDKFGILVILSFVVSNHPGACLPWGTLGNCSNIIQHFRI